MRTQSLIEFKMDHLQANIQDCLRDETSSQSVTVVLQEFLADTSKEINAMISRVNSFLAQQLSLGEIDQDGLDRINETFEKDMKPVVEHAQQAIIDFATGVAHKSGEDLTVAEKRAVEKSQELKDVLLEDHKKFFNGLLETLSSRFDA
ncbi:hypothetical protein HDE_01031 [Halotydeus destructor]|nr:hypothetical protein HDE_01031 [Halotydeus destructor]